MIHQYNEMNSMSNEEYAAYIKQNMTKRQRIIAELAEMDMKTFTRFAKAMEEEYSEELATSLRELVDEAGE